MAREGGVLRIIKQIIGCFLIGIVFLIFSMVCHDIIDHEKRIIVLERRGSTTPDERAIDLEALYAEINLKHFGGRLPNDTKIYWSADIEKMGFDGVTAQSEHVIRIGRSMKDRPNAAKMVLYHEVCHLKHAGHGTAFENEMKRLASENAFWGAW